MNTETRGCNFDFGEMVRLGMFDPLHVARTKRYLNPAAKADYDTVCTAIVTRIRGDRRISHPVGGLPICSSKLVFTDYHEFCSTLHKVNSNPQPMPI